MLNRSLYNALKSRFGRVKILNENITHQETKVFHDGEVRVKIKGGEYYTVCCPYCNDRRYRLEVSYLFGTVGPDGRVLDYLYHCFNESCEKHGFSLRDAMHVYMGDLKEVSPDKSSAKKSELLVSPGACIDLRELPDWHPSHIYLRSRGYDVKWMCERFGLVFCIKPYEWLPPRTQAFVYHRIIFPIIYNSQVVGWQARYVDATGNGKPPSKEIPKYYTSPGFQKTLYLYNYDYASSPFYRGYGLVMEGVMDVARVPHGVAVFGHTISDHQFELLSRAFNNRALVILFDRDAFESSKTMSMMISRTVFTRGVACIRLPDDRDPGDWDYVELMDLIATQAKQQGVDLSAEEQVRF